MANLFPLFRKSPQSIKADTLSGLTVALALVPEAIAFAFVAGVPPLSGLYAAFFIGIITAIFGGRPGMISGATGAVAVVLVSVVKKGNDEFGGIGIELLFATVILAGLIQLLIGVLKLGRFIRLVPHPVMMGFVNGLAIVIFLSQLDMFKIFENGEATKWLTGSDLAVMIGLVVLTMAIIRFLPKLTKAVPSSLAAIIVVSLLGFFFFDTREVGDLASVKGGLPLPHLPSIPLTSEVFLAILPTALIVALVGLIESLMTLQLIDEITETRGSGNRECLAQGAANVVTGFFQGMGGCAMIGQSLININSGGRGRLSGIVAAVGLLLFVLVGAPVIDRIPIAALVGVMFMVVIGTFEWSTFKILHRVPIEDVIVIVIVTAVTVWHDLALAVIVGVIVSALVFAWKSAKHVRLGEAQEMEDGSRLYHLRGLLYFGSVREFIERLTPKDQPDQVTIDFREARVCDQSSLEALHSLSERYEAAGKSLRLRHLSPECQRMLAKAGTVTDTDDDDPDYTVARF
ncbi:MAG: SulP family inorganic anion transporter [Verrucomicrobiota bacterium]